MDKVKLAIVGCGAISNLNVPGYLEHSKCEIVALCDPVPERATSKAKEWGINPDIFTEYLELQNKTYSRSHIATPRLPLCLFHAQAEISKKNCTFSFTKMKRTIAIHTY